MRRALVGTLLLLFVMTALAAVLLVFRQREAALNAHLQAQLRSQVLHPPGFGQAAGHNEPTNKSRSPTQVLVLMWLGGELDAGIRIRDKETIRELVDLPILNAVRDPNPARYIAFGYITTMMDDGSEDTTLLFLPWGRIKRGDEYLIADLEKLRKRFNETVKSAADNPQ